MQSGFYKSNEANCTNLLRNKLEIQPLLKKFSEKHILEMYEYSHTTNKVYCPTK